MARERTSIIQDVVRILGILRTGLQLKTENIEKLQITSERFFDLKMTCGNKKRRWRVVIDGRKY